MDLTAELAKAALMAALSCMCGSACAGLDEATWAEIGKTDALGWDIPVELPEAEPRLMATLETGELNRTDRTVTGILYCEAEFPAEESEKKPGCYVEVYAANKAGIITGGYQRTAGTNGVFVTRRVDVMEEGAFAVWGSLQNDAHSVKAKPSSCRLYSVPHAAVVREPAEGATLDDNTPDLVWFCEDPMGVSVELSKRSDFPENATIRAKVAHPVRFWTPEPLDPGTWHWRVRTASGFVTASRSFVQTAPRSADRTPPTLVCVPRAFSRAETKYGFTVGADTKKLTVTLDGRPLDARFRGTRAGVLPPEGGWPTGVSKLLVEASDAAGNVARATAWVSCAPHAKKVVWGGKGEPAQIDGRPFLPMAIYCVEDEANFDRV